MARSALLNVMVQAAMKAGRSLSRDFGEVQNLQVSLKGPGDYVSQADRKAEEIIFTELSKARPGYAFLMEERGVVEGEDAQHRWIVDPLDGTTNFLHGIPLFSISIALERQGQIVAGIVYNPAMDELYTAERGGGAFLNDRRLRVAGRGKLVDAVIGCGVPHLGRGHHGNFLIELRNVMAEVSGVRRLGSAALAGTSFPIDRHMTAKTLGFREPMRNSLDGVSDRDFALDFLSMAAICATHLSRLAEEIIIWSTPQFGFVRLSDSFSTGSSIMPQKKNPDAAELVRGKTGRVNGHLVGLLTVMKGMPLTYGKDMQEDKESVFDAAETLDLMLAATTGMVRDMTVNAAAMKKAAGAGHATATDLADWLVRTLGLPFREAHHVTGRAVALAEEKKVGLEKLSLDDLRSIHPGITEDIFSVLAVQNSVKSRVSFGGTAPSEVRKQIRYWKKRLAKA